MLKAIIGKCPHDWYADGNICSKRLSPLKFNFEDALNKCNDEEDKSADVGHYVENIANLLTVSQLRNYIGDSGNLSRTFHNKIRLNAIKHNGTWWAIHQFRYFKTEKIEQYCNAFSGKATQLGDNDFALFPNFDHANEGHDYSTLAYSPHTDNIELVSHKSRYRIVCTHKRIDKKGC